MQPARRPSDQLTPMARAHKAAIRHAAETKPQNMRYICVHGHFYQPPRENPSLEAIELQDSAYPYHDWNERVCSECYAPNGSSRIVDEKQEITEIVNNYAHMSFNFGPTLLSWIEQKAPKAYESILQADQQSQQRFGGHGSAIAQGYNHMILPLANRRDKVTQVKWGIADFEHRFKRKPDGANERSVLTVPPLDSTGINQRYDTE